MKDKYALTKKLKGLPELYQQAWELMTTDDDKREKLGLLTAGERVVLEKAHKVNELVYNSKQEAEKAVPRPDFDAGLPAEFIQLQARWREVSILRHQAQKIGETLRNLRPGSLYGMYCHPYWLRHTSR